jgi:hypothetical protein
MLIQFGLKNVASDDIFMGTAIGDVAEKLLEPLERIFETRGNERPRKALADSRRALSAENDWSHVMTRAMEFVYGNHRQSRMQQSVVRLESNTRSRARDGAIPRGGVFRTGI